jgi:hypothetical protein
MKEHGWSIQGLESDGIRFESSESAGILQTNAPRLVEALLEDRRKGRGLSFEDVLTMVATLERLILLESLEMVEGAYALNKFASSDLVDEAAFHEVMLSFVLLHRQDEPSALDLANATKHIQSKAEAARKASNYWTQLLSFEREAIRSFKHQQRHKLNHFREKRFSFDAATTVAEALVHGFGKWQNEECKIMKNDLMALDPKGTGRVPLKKFWAQPVTEIYGFTESKEYLRDAGALDESPGQAPHVRIANYLGGPSNCVAQSNYFVICCLDECAGLMGEIENAVRGPTADPTHLLRLVQNLSSSSVDAPRHVPTALSDKIQHIADLNGGTVPLHGRLFKQWLHFAFPNECPYPAKSPVAIAAPSQFNKLSVPSTFERKAHAIGDHLDSANSATFMDRQWHDLEILPFEEEGSYVARLLPRMVWMPYVAIIFIGVRLASNTWSAAMMHYHTNEFETAKLV